MAELLNRRAINKLSLSSLQFFKPYTNVSAHRQFKGKPVFLASGYDSLRFTSYKVQGLIR